MTAHRVHSPVAHFSAPRLLDICVLDGKRAEQRIQQQKQKDARRDAPCCAYPFKIASDVCCGRKQHEAEREAQLQRLLAKKRIIKIAQQHQRKGKYPKADHRLAIIRTAALYSCAAASRSALAAAISPALSRSVISLITW